MSASSSSSSIPFESPIPPPLSPFYRPSSSICSDELLAHFNCPPPQDSISRSSRGPIERLFVLLTSLFPNTFPRWLEWFRDSHLNFLMDQAALTSGTVWAAFSPNIINKFLFNSEGFAEDVNYGNDRPENQKLDVYFSHRSRLPKGPRHMSVGDSSPYSPVLLYIYGGAWGTGKKYFYRLLGQRFDREGFVTVIPDQRVWPRGGIEQQMSDVETALKWIDENIERYGGDRNKIFLAGQSSGAHCSMMTVLHRIQNLAAANSSSSFSSLPAIRGVLLLSAPFDLTSHYIFEWTRGVHRVSPMYPANGGFIHFPQNSPAQLIQTIPQHSLYEHLPPICILHGKQDKVVPYEQAFLMAKRITESLFLKIHDTDARILSLQHRAKKEDLRILDDLRMLGNNSRAFYCLLRGVDHFSIIMDLMGYEGQHRKIMDRIGKFVDQVLNMPPIQTPPKRKAADQIHSAPELQSQSVYVPTVYSLPNVKYERTPAFPFSPPLSSADIGGGVEPIASISWTSRRSGTQTSLIVSRL